MTPPIAPDSPALTSPPRFASTVSWDRSSQPGQSSSERSAAPPVLKPHGTSTTQPAERPAPGRIPITDLAVRDTHRLIASRFSEGGTVLSRLAPAAGTVSQLMELDDATNDRFLGEEGLLPGIGIHELVYGVRYAHIVNAAFTHASPTGGRFNTATRGAWYCSLDRATSLAEIAFHKLLALEEVAWPEEEVSTSDDYLADLTSPFHDVRDSPVATLGDELSPSVGASAAATAGARSSASAAASAGASVAGSAPSASTISTEPVPPAPRFARYLRSGPIPRCYARPQQLAERLLARQSNGIVYPSVRRPGGICVVCFRPALVYNVRRGARIELRLKAGRPFRMQQTREIPTPA